MPRYLLTCAMSGIQFFVLWVTIYFAIVDFNGLRWAFIALTVASTFQCCFNAYAIAMIFPKVRT